MTILSHFERKEKKYTPHDVKTRIHAVESLRKGQDIGYICSKYHISRISLWRWNKKYDGTRESLYDKSHRPLSKHPRTHTDEEIKWIKDIVRRNPNATVNELWYKLKRAKNYTRNPVSLYRMLIKLGFNEKPVVTETSKKHNKKYNTPENIGEKWQIDVKYVPKKCQANGISKDLSFYQYTCIDEATRERYLYWYTSHTPADTVNFVERCISFFKYVPKEIQTDNGIEFTYNRSDIKKIHPLTALLENLNIKHHKIRPRTPEHNGKVERSHRNDNERFYSYLTFYNLEDLRYQGKHYLRRSNMIPMKVLNYLTPKEMRAKLLEKIVA